MSRDYKNTTSRGKKPASKGAPGWLMLVTGLVVGLFIAALAWLATQPGGAPEKPAAKPHSETAAKKEPAKPKETPKPKPKPKPTPTPEAKKAPEKPRFEFYTILPEMETVVPPQELSAEVKEGVPQVKAPGTYMLQAGSFRTNDQADQLKAKIAFLGLGAEIQRVTNANDETWHRVRLGPYSDLATLNDARAKLKQQGIDVLLLKVDEKK